MKAASPQNRSMGDFTDTLIHTYRSYGGLIFFCFMGAVLPKESKIDRWPKHHILTSECHLLSAMGILGL